MEFILRPPPSFPDSFPIPVLFARQEKRGRLAEL